MGELSFRMEALVEWMEADCAADIGCDHAYVICEAVRRGKCRRGYACDIAAGPLSRAEATIASMNLQDKVEVRLQNGMVPILPDVSLFVIAGMGGSTMQGILQDWYSADGPKKDRRFLLSPHSDAPKLRRWLSQHGFEIVRERILQEGQHWYPILEVCFRELEKTYTLSEEEMAYGKNVRRDEQRALFLQEERSKWQLLLKTVPADACASIENRLRLVDRVMQAEK